jgi:hypothetical protein
MATKEVGEMGESGVDFVDPGRLFLIASRL